MKKFFIALVMLVMTAGAAHAQWYVGGGIGFGTSNSKNNNGQVVNKRTQFTFTPRVGYIINDNWLAGVKLGLTTGTYGSWGAQKGTSFMIAPYARYNFARLGRFAFAAEASIEFSTFGTSEAPKQSGFGFGLGIEPVVAFDINEHWGLETTIDLFRFGYQYTGTDTEGVKTSSNAFNIGGDGDNIFNLGGLTFSVIYKF